MKFLILSPKASYMKTILVPTDFSVTSIKAVNYAFGLVKQVGATKIVLFNSFIAPINVTLDPSLPVISIFDFEMLEDAAMEGLNYVKNSLINDYPNGVQIELLAKYGLLSENINQTCDEVEADVIVMGITGGGIVSEKIFGSNTIVIAKFATMPVIIVPPNVTYKLISKLLLVSDFVEIEEFVHFNPIKKVLDDTHSQLLILNVASSAHYSLYEGAYECSSFKKLFSSYKPEFHFLVNPNFIDAINTFVSEHKADIIIVIPKKHSVLESLFKQSHTKDLAFHSNIPLMAVHEQ